MPVFIPPYMGEEIKSNAEKKMYEVLQQLNMKQACVLHSLGLPKHQSKIYGEIDFVVVCERGVACLEIKGGRVSCKDGKWFFTDRYGVEREKPEGPFAQVTGNMFSLREVLKKQFSNNQHLKNVLMASGVVFPDIEFTSTAQEIIPEIIYDKRVIDINEYMNRMFDYWESRNHREPSKLSPTDVIDVVNFLRGNFSYIVTLNDRLDDIEKHLVRLTEEQAQIMQALSVNEHLLIQGNAGTGKTLLAVDYSKRQAEQGKKVLYLTYNKNLAHNVERQIEENKNLKIINIHALFGEYVPVNVEKMKENPGKYFAEILPEEFYNYLTELPKEELEKMQCDLLVMDEGQDILKPIYLFALDYLIKGGFKNGHWTVFYDEKQNIYNPEYQDGMEIIESYTHTKFKLFVNCRNTVQIGTYSSKVSGVAYIIVVDCEKGTLSHSALSYLNEVSHYSNDIAVIINKCDKKTRDDVLAIKNHVSKLLVSNCGKECPIVTTSKYDEDATEKIKSLILGFNPQELYEKNIGTIVDYKVSDLEKALILIEKNKALDVSDIDKEIAKREKAKDKIQAEIKIQQENMKRKMHDEVKNRIINNISLKLNNNVCVLADAYKISIDNFQEKVISIVRPIIIKSVENYESMAYEDIIKGINVSTLNLGADAEEVGLILSDVLVKIEGVTSILSSVKLEEENKGNTDKGKYKAVTSLLAIATDVVAPPLEILIVFLPDIINLVKAFLGNNQEQQLISEIQRKVIPQIVDKLKEQLEISLVTVEQVMGKNIEDTVAELIQVETDALEKAKQKKSEMETEYENYISGLKFDITLLA